MLIRSKGRVAIIVMLFAVGCGGLPSHLEQFHYHELSCREIPEVVIYRIPGYSPEEVPKPQLVAAMWNDGCVLRVVVTSSTYTVYEEGKLSLSEYQRLVDAYDRRFCYNEPMLTVDAPNMYLNIRHNGFHREFIATPNVGTKDLVMMATEILSGDLTEIIKIHSLIEWPSCWLNY